MTDVELAIRLSADASDASRAFEDVGSSAVDMANDVSRAAGDAEASTRDLASGADAMASSSTKAAGGLGDLGGALALMPGPLGAVGGGMEALQPAIMGAAGAGDLLNLAMESNIVVTARAKAAAVAHAVASRASSAASKAWAAGQWLLNAALAANPIGLVVIAVAALVAGVVLAYKRSETFRNVVDAAMKAARTAVGWVVDKVGALVEVVRDKAGPIMTTLSDAVGKAKGLVVPYFEAMTAPIRTVVGLVKDVVHWIGQIDLPDLSALPGMRVAGRGTVTTVGGSVAEAAGGGTLVFIDRVSTLDPQEFVRDLRVVLRREGIALGGPS